jgi:hypothetical protein
MSSPDSDRETIYDKLETLVFILKHGTVSWPPHLLGDVADW